MLKILIVDRNVLFREGLSNLLQREPDIKIVGEAESIREAINIARLHKPDLVLVDEEIPDIDEYRGIRLLLAQCANMQALILSMHLTDEQLIRAIRNGVRGYVQKNHSLSTLMASIRAMERGEAVIPPIQVGCLLEEINRLSSAINPDVIELLTPREIEVLRELSRGSSNREIANNLDIAENTVKVHVHNILEKLNLRNRRQAARLARSHELAQIPYNSLMLTMAS